MDEWGREDWMTLWRVEWMNGSDYCMGIWLSYRIGGWCLTGWGEVGECGWSDE